MTDVLAAAIDGLRQLGAAVTAEEVSEVLWLCQQSARWGGLPAPDFDQTPAASAPRRGGTPEPPADGEAKGIRSSRLRLLSGPPGQNAGAARVHPASPLGTADGLLDGAIRVRLPDAPALPDARKLSRALRPLRYDPRRVYPADGIEEEATALRTAQAGLRLPVQRTTRRRRFDLDLVLDVGGSGLLWTRLATELRSMFEVNGAFRDVRFWLLDSDSPELPLLPARDDAARHSWDVVGRAPRLPLVVVLTDGTGRSWQTRDVYRPLRTWTAYGKVLLVQLLPTDMWNRTALRALPVMFRPGSDGHHRAERVDVRDVDLSVVDLDRSGLAGALAIPVIGLDASWLRSWLPLLRGHEAGMVPGYALLIPAPGTGHGPASGEPPEEGPNGEERVHRFMLTASRGARRLARLLSLTTPTLPGMRKIRYELLPDSEPQILAEVMLGGLMYWTPTTVAETLSGQTVFQFYPDVQDVLRERPGGMAELARDFELVTTALWSDPGAGPGYDGVAVIPDVNGELVPVSDGKLPLLPPYPLRVGLPVSASSAPDGDGEAESAEPGSRPVQIGIWGATASGRSTYLAILGMLGLGRARGGTAVDRWPAR